MVVTQVPPTWLVFETNFSSLFMEKERTVFVGVFFLGQIEILVFVVIRHFQHLLGNIIVEPVEKHFVPLVSISLLAHCIELNSRNRLIEIKSTSRIRYRR